MKSKSTLKVMIFGLDGATFDLMLPFIEKGDMPNLAYILEKGAWGELESTYPPMTAAAWPSFMTGENPGKHGILQFIPGDSGQALDGYQQKAATTETFSGRTFFDVMRIHGKRAAAITIPVTYPPWDINGIMISGFPSPDNNKIYSISKDISISINEPLNFEAGYYKTTGEEQILEDCLYRDKLRSKLTIDLLQRYEFDCFSVVFGGIDRACHDFWKYHESEYPGINVDMRLKYKDAIYRNYKLADKEIGKYLDCFGDKATLFVISDHGSGRTPFYSFNINVWLKKKKFLSLNYGKALFREMAKKSFKSVSATLTPKNKKSTIFFQGIRKNAANINVLGSKITSVFDWEKTKAFYYPLMYPVDGIMINQKGRQSNGSVNPGKEKKNIVDKIIKELIELKDNNTGGNIVSNALPREEIYSGPFIENFPDIIYTLNKKYLGENSIFGPIINNVPKFRLLRRSGLHTMHGIFIAFGQKIKPMRIKGARIIDVAPTILYCSGLPIPETADGRVLKEIFQKEIIKKQSIKYFNFEEKLVRNQESINDIENLQMVEKLRSLGYID